MYNADLKLTIQQVGLHIGSAQSDQALGVLCLESVQSRHQPHCSNRRIGNDIKDVRIILYANFIYGIRQMGKGNGNTVVKQPPPISQLHRAMTAMEQTNPQV